MMNNRKYLARAAAGVMMGVTVMAASVRAGESTTSTPAHILVIQGTRLYEKEVDPFYYEELEKQGKYLLDSVPLAKLDWELLKNYNAVVMFSTPSLNDQPGTKAFQAKLPLLSKFVSEGGGLLVMGDVQYPVGGEFKQILGPMGADVLSRERILDDVNTFQQQQYRQEWMLTSRNITKGHPITRGVESITVPNRTYANNPIRVDDKWTVLVKGEKQAYSLDPYFTPPRKTYESEPPMLASREWGKGRVVVFPVQPTWTIQNGNHRIWEGMVLTPLKPLFANMYAWLSEPSLTNTKGISVGNFTLAKRPKAGRDETDVYGVFPSKINEEELSVFGGLIGAHSTLSSGSNSPAQWCKEAKKRGLSYLVFTEDLSLMSKAKWAELVSACEKASDEKFSAVAGLEYKDENDSHRLIFNLNQFVPPQYYDEAKKKIINTSGLLWLDWPTIALTDISLSNFDSPVSWQSQKFYNALVLKSYFKGNLIDDSWDRYKRLSGMYYWVRPMTFHPMTSIQEMDTAKGFKTYALAPRVKGIPEAFRRAQDKTPRGNRTFVSDGPMIQEFRMIGDAWTLDPWESYYLWNMGEVAPIRMHVTSDAPISDVKLYQGDELIRHYRPLTREFKAEYMHSFSRSGAFYMEVQDTAGHRAISYNLMMRNEINWTMMCADLQNNLESYYFPNESGPWRIRGKWRGGAVWGAGMMCVTGSTGIRSSGHADIPDGLDAIGESFRWRELPQTFSTGGQEGLVSDRLHFVFSSQDASVCRFGDWVDSSAGRGRSQYWEGNSELTTYQCEKNTFAVTVVEQRFVAKKDIPLADQGSNGVELVISEINANTKLFANYTVVDKEGNKVSGLRKDLAKPLRVSMAPDGYTAVWPQYWGEGAIFPMDGLGCEAIVSKDSTKIGFKRGSSVIPKGTEYKFSFAVFVGLGVAKDDRQFDAIRKAYGANGRSDVHPELTTGKVLDERMVLRLKAEQGRVEGVFHKLSVNNRMLVLVEGLNPDWPCVAYDKLSKTITTIGVRPDTATAYWSGLFTNDSQLVIGNAVRAYPTTDERLKITLVSAQDGKLKLEVNNPTEDTIKATLTRMIGLDAWPVFSKNVKVKPGESQQVDIP
jgi:hypothetical protein